MQCVRARVRTVGLTGPRRVRPRGSDAVPPVARRVRIGYDSRLPRKFLGSADWAVARRRRWRADGSGAKLGELMSYHRAVAGRVVKATQGALDHAVRNHYDPRLSRNCDGHRD